MKRRSLCTELYKSFYLETSKKYYFKLTVCNDNSKNCFKTLTKQNYQVLNYLTHDFKVEAIR